MPVVQRSEFALALNQVASERGVDVEVVLETVKNAILAAYRKDHPDVELEEFRAELDPNTGEASIFHNDVNVTPPGFGRIAAQTAKQVILQKIREKEKEAVMTDYRVKIGTVVGGMVLRFAGPNLIIDIGKTESIMPASEQIGNENYHLNQRLAVYLSEIREGAKGEEIVVSRAHPNIISALFKREVPEIAQGSVEIKAIAREAGTRTKIAVYSNQQGIDPVGSCVGQKGVRVQAIIQEFNGLEKIDIIQWSDDMKTYISQALSPAKNVQVDLNEETKVATVRVPREELSLAIGKDGQNVRLASKLTGYRIEIEGKEEEVAAVSEEKAEVKEETPSKEVEAKEETAATEAAPVPQVESEEKEAETEVKTGPQEVVTSDDITTAAEEVKTLEEVTVAAEETKNE